MVQQRARLTNMLAVLGCLLVLFVASQSPAEEYRPQVAEASQEGEQAIKQFRVPEFLITSLYASEPLLANPVTFCFDEQGRIFVGETFRQQKGVEDNRRHMDWLDDDLALQTVEERLAMFQKHLKETIEEYSKEHDRIVLIEDTNDDGKADKSTVFADGFNGILDGTGAGLLARHGNVYYTCIPKLWLLKDLDGDGKADVRNPLHHGYGVRVAFRGHDMHGLRFGPDGKLYYSIGDRGYHVETEGKTFHRPDTGSVFRCNPDGSDLEVFAFGLRNPQELAFDKYGNLFTGDNNSDSGDKARWVYVAEGADIGWRMYYQYLKDRGPWNREKLWHPQHPGQPAYIVPPIINLADGPSGLTYYPGVGLPEKYQDHFFLCDFRGGSANSGVRSFAVEPKGASFELVDSHQFIWSILGTDVEFGYDGGLYVTDWVDGWNGPGKGRIYKFAQPEIAKDPVVMSVKTLFAEGFESKTTKQLGELLAHADMRVRQEAQFTLVDRATADTPEELAQTQLATAAHEHDNQLARLHGIWGIGQIGRMSPKTLAGLEPLLKDGDAEVRAQSARVLGDARYAQAQSTLVELLKDKNARVQYFAAIGLGKIGDAASGKPLASLLDVTGDSDPTLRHALAMGLAGTQQPPALEAFAEHPSVGVRMGAVLALRRHASPKLASFLSDTDPLIVDEAARAIHDLPVLDAYPQLSQLASRSELSESTWRRVINANYRHGGDSGARAIAGIAGKPSVPEVVRIEALDALGDWGEPSGRDRVLGDWRPIESRDPQVAALALTPALGSVFTASDAIREAGTKAAAKLGIKEVGPLLVSLTLDPERSASVRAQALNALQSLKDPKLPEATEAALRDTNPKLRATGQRILSVLKPEKALPVLKDVLEKGSQAEQQSAYWTLASMMSPEADALLVTEMDRLLAGNVPLPSQLDLLEAVATRDVSSLKERLEKYESNRSSDDPLAAWRETLHGGDADRGRTIFFERSQVSCVRCHKVRGQGGEVGPDLSGVAVDKQRDYLLASMVTPNKDIAKGFETVVLAMDDGKVHVGLIKAEDEETITLITPESRLVTLQKDEIDERGGGKSAMPEDLLKHLTKTDLRDLVEFLANQKTKPTEKSQ